MPFVATILDTCTMCLEGTRSCNATVCTLPFIRYADFAPMFKAEMFDPDQWASIFKKAGAQCKPKP